MTKAVQHQGPGTYEVHEFGPEQPTLRDRFAMAAMTGISKRYSASDLRSASTRALMAEQVYALADEMLKAREVKP